MEGCGQAALSRGWENTLSKSVLAEAGGVKPSEYTPWARAPVG